MDSHSHDQLVCTVCRFGVPLAKRWGTACALGALGIAGGATTKRSKDMLMAGLIGLAVGALIDAAAEPLCSSCSVARVAA